MSNSWSPATLNRIREALEAASKVLTELMPGAVEAHQKSFGRGPVTEADRMVDRVLRQTLLRDGEGWLSEESVDDLERLDKNRVWVVDPLDGTLEFVAGIPEWCVSVALVEDGQAVAGGICNPASGELFLGSLDRGVTYNGKSVRASRKDSLEGAVVLASRSEVKRGEWEPFRQSPIAIRSAGSVAYKLALVSAGLADATWTLTPKNEWDIAGGVALIRAAGGFVQSIGNRLPSFNNESTVFPGLIASGPHLREQLLAFLQPYVQNLRSASQVI